MLRECPKHGLTEYVQETPKQIRCKKCRVAHVIKWRHKKKERLVAYKGGKCFVCGYDRCIDALEFHHLDPTQKEFALSKKGLTHSFARHKAEADKCVLLCANCHREVEAGLVLLGSLIGKAGSC